MINLGKKERVRLNVYVFYKYCVYRLMYVNYM